MNFLAHLFLAGEDEGLLLGNFIADGIRGKEIENYPEHIRKGVILHRKIDYYTDTHPVVRRTTALLRNTSGKYAPVVSDVVYDHFLAINWSDYYTPSLLSIYAKEKYDFLRKNLNFIPERMHELLEVMAEQDWLVNYSKLEGIEITLKNLSQRVHFANNMASSIIDLKKHYKTLEADFKEFFPQLQSFVREEAHKLNQTPTILF